jgi:hypothetical protein
VRLVIHYEVASGRPPRRFTLLQRLALTPTPRVLLQGVDFGAWETAAFEEALKHILERPARARLGLSILAAEADRLRMAASAEILDPGEVEHAALYVAAYGRRDMRVLQWEGPARFPRARVELERALSLVPGALAADSGVVAFIQNRRSGEVLQVLSLATCS